MKYTRSKLNASAMARSTVEKACGLAQCPPSKASQACLYKFADQPTIACQHLIFLQRRSGSQQCCNKQQPVLMASAKTMTPMALGILLSPRVVGFYVESGSFPGHIPSIQKLQTVQPANIPLAQAQSQAGFSPVPVPASFKSDSYALQAQSPH